MILPLALLGATWEDAPDWFGAPGDWTHEVELGDVDGDGAVDVILVNGGGYSTPGRAEESRLFLNPNHGPPLVEAPGALGPAAHARTAKVRDFDGDGDQDVLLVLAYGEVSRLLDNTGGGVLVDVSERLPSSPRSFGDGEPLDVDDDGDLDVVLADWGEGDALDNGGGPVVLWRNDGTGRFTEDLAAMPVLAVGMSWDLEGADVDGDRDLDVLVSCKVCVGSVLLENDGTGAFTDRSASLPQRPNNYDVEVLDLDDDGLVEVVTVNDGRLLRESVWTRDAAGSFTDVSEAWIPPGPGADDNVLVTLDVDDDGDRDVVVGSLSGADRVFLDDGSTFSVVEDALAGPRTPGTLGLAAADLDDDGRIDLVMAQGEAATTDHVFRGVDVPVDTHPPVLAGVARDGDRVFAVAHDRIAPVAVHDVAVALRTDAGDVPAFHRGAGTWSVTLPPAATRWRLCATDRRGLEACSAEEVLPVPEDTGAPPPEDTGTAPPPPPEDTGAAPPEDTGEAHAEPRGDGPAAKSGCGCAAGSRAPGAPILAVAAALRRRRPARGR